jgi:hypothetical protein
MALPGKSCLKSWKTSMSNPAVRTWRGGTGNKGSYPGNLKIAAVMIEVTILSFVPDFGLKGNDA